jgi:ribosomal protein S4
MRTVEMRFYLRTKNPRYEKRTNLYRRKIKLLADPWKRKRLLARKVARIKQIAGKILRPFYGHLTLKQFTKIIMKSRRKVNKKVTRTEVVLSCLENRLDVIVYRLN